MAKKIILHPFLFGVFPVASLYAQNIDLIPPRVVLAPLLLVLAATGLLLLLLRLVFREREKGAVVASLLLFFLFSYGMFTSLVVKCSFGPFVFNRNMHRVPLYAVLMLGLGLLLWRCYRRSPAQLTKFLNVTSLALLAMTVVTGVAHYASAAGHKADAAVPDDISNTAAAPEEDDKAPDIYYIILDGYGRDDTLAKVFNYDNQPFLRFLQGKGFRIPAKARSNYAMTALSIPTALGMDYIRQGKFPANHVKAVVEQNGYRYISFNSMNPGFVKLGNKAFSLGTLFNNEFSLQLIKSTLIDAIAQRFRLYAGSVRENILDCFDQLEQLAVQPGRKFVYAHIVCPHPPYVFGPNGEARGMPSSEISMNIYLTPWDDKEGYIQQVQYMNKMTEVLVEDLIAKSRVPPVIVLQGDHGPHLTASAPLTPSELRLRILNAYYLPGAEASLIDDHITPVNTFRVILSHYLKANLPRLEDRCYYSIHEMPFEFTEFTNNQ